MMALLLVGTQAELGEGSQRVVELERDDALVVNAGGHYYAISNTCTHQALDICGGPVEDLRIKCVHHGSWFALTSGKALNLPAFQPVRTYPTVVENGQVFIETEG